MALSSSSSAHRAETFEKEQVENNAKIQRINAISQSFPDVKWREMLGLIIAHETSAEDIQLAANIIGTKWLNEGSEWCFHTVGSFIFHSESTRACIAFLLGGDIDQFLIANVSFSQVDRLKQALILHQISKATNYSDGLEKVNI